MSLNCINKQGIKNLMLGVFFLFSTTIFSQPTITNFSPNSGPVGTLVTITGTNLSNPTAITIAGVSAIPISNNGITLVAMVMPGATTGDVNITTAGGTANGSGTFSVTLSQVPNIQLGNKLVGTGAIETARQGWSVSISADGNTAIVGGYSDNTGGYSNNSNVGAAWVYTRSGGVWTQQGNKLVGTGAVGPSEQGRSVSISADGNTAIVGGSSDDRGVGAVWVYTRSGGVWTQQGNKLVGTGAVGPSEQGYSVSISADGNTAIVGGYFDNTSNGAAWVFTRSGGVWTQQGNKLVGTGSVGVARQGRSVSISADGNTAIVGGFIDNGNVGAAWVYTRNGGVWSQQGNKLVGTGAVKTAFQGASVSISADGNTAVVGGWNDNGNVGAAWVYTRSEGKWTQQGNKLVGTGAAGTTQQGHAVSITADGNTIIVGGHSDNDEKGAVWVYTYLPPAPTITSFAPITAAAGAPISITGTNFTGTSIITLGGTPVNSFTVVSSTSIIAIVGKGSTGAVSLTTPDGTASLAGFTFIPAPTITSFAPTSAGEGSIISITGTNFTGTSVITLGGTPVTSFTVVSSTSIVAIIGTGATGVVSLTTPGGTASLAGFTFIPPPTITSFAPTSGGVGSIISITGANFTGTSVITLGGTPVTSFTVVSSTSIVAIVGMGATGAVSLTTLGGTASLVGFTFIPLPTIISFAPTIAGSGALISITGTNFNNTSVLTLGGTPVTSFTVVSSTSIVAIVATGTTGAVSLSTPGGTASLDGFNFVPEPTITSFSPTSAAAGAIISINGTNFNNTSVLTLGGIPVSSFTVVSSTSIVAIVGTGATGAVSLTTPGGIASLGGFIFLLSPPNIVPNISNVFSPNGDGINDVWQLSFLQAYPNATVQILNRYGQVVFFSNGYVPSWDGKFKGMDLPIGTYYYIINPKNGRDILKGAVTIIR
ncbi:MAG: IPT/TIG domain-containing protein [Bacteroidota bacterium]